MIKSENIVSNQKLYEMYHSGDSLQIQKAKDLAVCNNERYIHYFISRNYSAFEKRYREDLFQCGVIGLLLALDKFNGKNALITYARVYIFHEMSAFVRFITKTGSVHYTSLQGKILRAEEFLQKNGERTTIENISEITGLSPAITKREQQLQPAMENAQLVEEIQDSFSMDRIIDKVAAEQLMTSSKSLSLLHYQILYLYIYEKKTFESIGKGLHINARKASRLYNESIQYMKHCQCFISCI